MAKIQLTDQYGNPISSSTLSEEQAIPAVTGIDHPFDAAIAPGLHPAKLARTLRDAARGEMHDFLTLAEEIEEREPHYRYVIETRRNAVSGLRWQVEPATDKGRDIDIADALRDELVEKPAFDILSDQLLDGLSKGYSASEMVWETGSAWWPRQFIWRDQRLFQWDQETRTQLHLRVRGMADGMPLEPLKYAVHVPLLKMGLPARNGLARLGAWLFMMKSFSMRDWAQFLEIYGMPMRLGKYGPGASLADRKVLLKAVRELGRDAAAIVPKEMDIELVESKGFSDKPFESHARFLDEQASKVVIGKPGDGTASSKAGEEVLDKVRADIRQADARDITHTVRSQIIHPAVDLNFGPQKRYPNLRLVIPDRKDLQVWSNAVTQLVDRGLEVEQSQVYEVIGLKEPARGADGSAVKLLKPASTGAKAPPQPPVEKASAYRLDPRACPSCGPATLRADDPEQDEADRLVAGALDGWEPDMAPILEALQAAADRSDSYEAFQAELERLAADLPVGPLAARIATLNLIGRGRGDADLD